MVLKAAILVIICILSVIGCLVCLILGIIYFANNKPGRFGWLAGFVISLVLLITSLFLFVQKAVNKAKDFTKNQISHFEESMNAGIDTTSANGQDNRYYLLHSNEQINIIKSYLPDTLIHEVPDQFYCYFGFRDYFRFPIRYPYSVHCLDVKENGELFNEKNVSRFDEGDNGEVSMGITGINKLAYDKNFLLSELVYASSETPDKKQSHFILFEFGTESKTEVKSENELFLTARKKGYKGIDSLMTIEQYDSLFK